MTYNTCNIFRGTIMSVFSVFSVLVFCLSTTVFGLRLPLADQDSAVFSHIEITEDAVSNVRYKRSPHYLPDRANVTFNIDGASVRLNIKRNPNIDVNIPVYMTVDGRIQRVEFDDIQGVGLYQDLETGACLLLHKDGYSLQNHTKVFGTFYAHSQHYAIQPAEDNQYGGHQDGSQYGGQNGGRPTHVISKAPSQALVFESTDIPDAHLNKAEYVQKHGRRRRQSGQGNFQVEVLPVLDYKIYRFWLDQSTGGNNHNEALSLMRQYYAYTLNGMDTRYKSISGMDFSIDILGVAMHISVSPNDSPWSEQFAISGFVNTDSVLEAFLDWVTDMKRGGDLPAHDHAMGFTGYNVAKIVGGIIETDSSGIAYKSSLCKSTSVSIVEDSFNILSITIAAHELGHSLGSSHDGSDNLCSSDDNYIMATTNRVGNDPVTGRNLWIFSQCSLQAFTDYFAQLDDANNNCMLSSDPGSQPAMVDVPMAEVYTPDQTCVFDQGPESYVCRSLQNFSTICISMFCKDMTPDSNLCYTALPPENTPCGRGKWCEMGVCTSNPRAPDVPDNCPLGDRPGIVSNGQTCAQLVADQPRLCYGQTIQRECCSSCRAIETNNPDCPYGDKADCSALSRTACYTNEAVCCGLCTPLKNVAFVGCEYGDRLGGCDRTLCNRYSPSNREACCESCYDGPPITTPTPVTARSPMTTPTSRPKGPTPDTTTGGQPATTKAQSSSVVPIAVGVGAGVLSVIVIIVVICVCRRKKTKKTDKTHSPKSKMPNSYENSAFNNVETVTEAPRYPPPRRVSGVKAPPAAAIVHPTRSSPVIPSAPSANHHTTKPMQAPQPITAPLNRPNRPPPRRSIQAENSNPPKHSPSHSPKHTSNESPRHAEKSDNRFNQQQPNKPSPKPTDHSDSRFKPHPPSKLADQSESRPRPQLPMKPPPPKLSDQPNASSRLQVSMQPPTRTRHKSDEGVLKPKGMTIYADGYMMPVPTNSPSSQSPQCPNSPVHYTAPNKPKFKGWSSTLSNIPRPTVRNLKTKHYRRTQDLSNTANQDLSNTANQDLSNTASTNNKNFEMAGRKMSDTYDSIGEIQNLLQRSEQQKSGPGFDTNQVSTLERRPTLPANHPRGRLSTASGDSSKRSDASQRNSYNSQQDSFGYSKSIYNESGTFSDVSQMGSYSSKRDSCMSQINNDNSHVMSDNTHTVVDNSKNGQANARDLHLPDRSSNNRKSDCIGTPVVPRKNYGVQDDDGPHYEPCVNQATRPRQIPQPQEPPRARPRKSISSTSSPPQNKAQSEFNGNDNQSPSSRANWRNEQDSYDTVNPESRIKFSVNDIRRHSSRANRNDTYGREHCHESNTRSQNKCNANDNRKHSFRASQNVEHDNDVFKPDESYNKNIEDVCETYDQADALVSSVVDHYDEVNRSKNHNPINTRHKTDHEPTQYSSIDELEIHI